MPNYLVENVEHVKSVPGKDGRPPVNVLKLTLSNGTQSGVVELFDNTQLNPQVGQQLEGTVEQSEYGLKFKPARRASGGGGGGRPRSPEERRSIERQACMKAAVEYACGFASPPAAEEVVKVAALFHEWVAQT